MTRSFLSFSLLLSLPMVLSGAAPEREREPLTAEVTQEDLDIQVELSGMFVAEDKDEISMEPKEYRGELIVTEILPEGTAVKKGDVLIEFDEATLEKSLEEAKNDRLDAEVKLKKAEADRQGFEIERESTLSRLKKEVELAEREVAAAKEKATVELEKKERSIFDAKLRLKDAEVDFKQLKELYAERELHTATENILIEREERNIENAKRAVKESEWELEHFKKFEHTKDTETKSLEVDKKIAELKKTEIQFGADLTEKDAEVAKTKRALEKALKKEADLDQDVNSLRVLSPRDGVVLYGKTDDDMPAGIVMFGGGNEMRVGGRVRTHDILLTVAEMGSLSIKMRVLENDIQHMEPGLKITVFPDAFPNLKLDGELTKVDQTASREGLFSEVREFTVKGRYEGVAEQLRSGMNCRVTVHADSVPDAVQVPVVAVFEEDGEYFCNVKDGRKVERRVVTIGATNGTVVQITDGLAKGDVVYLYDPDRA